MALRNPAVGGSKGDTKTSAKHVVAEMEDLRTGVRFPPPPPIVQCKELLFAPVLALVGLLGVTYLRVTWYL
jgi:hypothetical protein